MSPNKNINYTINFVSEATFSIKKIYNIFYQKEEIIRVYLNNIKSKNQIRNSILQYIVFTFIVKKSDRSLRVCINYRNFNILTVKNCNILLLIQEILQQLYKIKYYSKFDIIAVFNKIRIYSDNKYKIVFIICYNLFKYIVISFKLYNIPIIFQFFINKIFSLYLNNFCIIYIDNILIYSNIEIEYKNYINKVFAKFYNADLYLNINKFFFC